VLAPRVRPAQREPGRCSRSRFRDRRPDRRRTDLPGGIGASSAGLRSQAAARDFAHSPCREPWSLCERALRSRRALPRASLPRDLRRTGVGARGSRVAAPACGKPRSGPRRALHVRHDHLRHGHPLALQHSHLETARRLAATRTRSCKPLGLSGANSPNSGHHARHIRAPSPPQGPFRLQRSTPTVWAGHAC